MPHHKLKAHGAGNAVVESFVGTLKNELVHHVVFPTREAARQALFHFIDVYYNRKRRHSHVGGVSPLAFEEAARHAG